MTSSCMANRRQFYEHTLLGAARTLLSAMDRAPTSASRGCMDREFWARSSWRQPDPFFQRGLLVLGYLYLTPFPSANHDYHEQPALLAWIEDGIRFWIHQQDARGSFRPGNRVSRDGDTDAFVLCDMATLYGLLADRVSPELHAAWRCALDQASVWLKKLETAPGRSSYRRMGIAAAWLELARVADWPAYAERGRECLRGVLAEQSPEGWFPENGGADPACLTLTLQYLSLAHDLAADSTLLSSARGVTDFLQYFIHPDDTVGGAYGSMGGTRCYPAGLEYFSRHLPLAEAIAGAGVRGMIDGDGCSGGDVDLHDEIPFLSSCVHAHRMCCAHERTVADAASAPESSSSSASVCEAELPRERTCERLFRQAGIYVRSSRTRYVVFSPARGGVLLAFDKVRGQLFFSSCGYCGVGSGGLAFTTQGRSEGDTLDLRPALPEIETDLLPNRKIILRGSCFHDAHAAGELLLKKSLWRRILELADERRKRRRDNDPADGSWSRELSFVGETLTIRDELELESEPIRVLHEFGSAVAESTPCGPSFRRQDFASAWQSANLAPAASEKRFRQERILPDDGLTTHVRNA